MSRTRRRSSQAKLDWMRAEIYATLTRCIACCWPAIPSAATRLDYLNGVFTDFIERTVTGSFRDDPAIVGGWARLGGHSVMVIGHQKGRDTKENIRRNFGMAHPEGIARRSA
jgi:acetyl-CoA carboxylase carboxyl transferase subunit alpha